MGGSSSTKSNQFSFQTGHESTEPWGVQTPYLKSAFNRAEDAYNKTMAQGPYQGDYVAVGDDKNRAAFQQAFDFGTDPTSLAYNRNLMSQANGWINDGSQWMKQGAEGLYSLAGDQTDTIIANASKYADSPYIAGAINAAMSDANRQASENTLPNLYRGAAGNNALNSDRAALSQGVVERGLAELAGNISADMRYKAYDKGIDTSKGELDSRRQSYGALGQMGKDAAGLGMAGLEGGIANQSRLNQMSAAGAEGLRTLRQLGLDNDMAKYQGSMNFPWAALSNYYSIIGDKSWGGTRDWNQMGFGTSESTTTQKPGAAQVAGGVLGGIGSLFGGGGGASGGASSGLFGFL
jgi:hypothetical protein